MAATYELIESVTLGSAAATVTFSSIPGTFDDLAIVGSVRMSQSSIFDLAKIRFNGAASDTSHSSRGLYGDGSTPGSTSVSDCRLGAINGPTSTSNTFTSFEIYLPNYAGGTNKSYSSTCTHETNATGAYIQAWAGLWSSTSAITQVQFLSALYSGNFVIGSSVHLYGITKA